MSAIACSRVSGEVERHDDAPVAAVRRGLPGLRRRLFAERPLRLERCEAFLRVGGDGEHAGAVLAGVCMPAGLSVEATAMGMSGAGRA